VEDTDFKLWYIGNTSTKNGIGIVLDKSLKDGVVDIKLQGDKIILVKLLVGDLVFNVISAYDPEIGLNETLRCSSVRSWTYWLVVCPSLRSSLYEEISMGIYVLLE
jgi:hypothetical protein